MLADHARKLLDAARPSLAWHADRDHPRWREEVRAAVRSLAGSAPPAPLRPTWSEEVVAEDLHIRRYTFATADGREVLGQLIYRELDRPRPVVLFCQGRNPPRDYVPSPGGKEMPWYGSQEFPRLGYPVFMLNYGLFNGWDLELVGYRDETTLLSLALGLLGRAPLGYVIDNQIAGLEWLCEQPWVDPQRLVVFGRSLGGQVALHTALLTDRPVTVALSSSVGRYPTIYGRNANGGGAHALPGILAHCDMPDLLAALCPHPLYVQAGSADETMPLEDVDVALATARSAYGSVGLADRVAFDRMVGKGHVTDIPAVVRYLERTVGTADAAR